MAPLSRAGLVALVGRPNSGKSTILNRLVGQKVSIVSDKPQTTRHRILGILTEPGYQIVFVDTPGVHRPGFRLNEHMMQTVEEALRGVDLVVQVVDVSEPYGKGEQFVVDLVGSASKPTLLVLNKVDRINKGKVLPVLERYRELGSFLEMVPISALEGDNMEVLRDLIVAHLPQGAPLYPEEEWTDQSERFLVSELIREKVLAHTRRELPYSSAVLVEEFDETERDGGFVRIEASIIVERPSQKKIVVGRAGQMIKRIGTEARADIESVLGLRQIFLGLTVRVEPGWRNQERFLTELGVSAGQYTLG